MIVVATWETHPETPAELVIDLLALSDVVEGDNATFHIVPANDKEESLKMHADLMINDILASDK